MSQDVADKADRALEDALEATGARDPRGFYRDRLKALKQADPTAYERAVEYYREILLPVVADGVEPPLDAWTEYGRRLAEALAPGRTVGIDPTGLAHPYERPMGDRLVLHLPDNAGVRALLVGLPPQLTRAQRAAYDVLVEGKQRLRG